MSWFKKLFTSAETDLETFSNHVEGEFKTLIARVEALEGKTSATVTPPAAATSTASAPSAVAAKS